MKINFIEEKLKKEKGKQQFVSINIIIDGEDKTSLFFSKKQANKLSLHAYETAKSKLNVLSKL